MISNMELRRAVSIKNNRLVDRILDSLVGIEGKAVVKIIEESDFYKLNFECHNSKRCPFSIWIERVSGDHLFLNIGLSNREATVYHFSDITSDVVVDDVVDFIHFFLKSVVVETSIYCNDKLKRVNYVISDGGKKFEFSFLNESYLFCIKKKKNNSTYSPWLS